MLDSLLQGVVEHPHEEDRWLVLADWVEEHDDPRRGELLRLHRRLLATCTEPDKHPGRAEWQARMVALLGAGVRPVVPRRTIAVADGVDMTFAWCQPGTFLMGSPANEPERGDDETQHRVTLTRGFWLGIHPVTQRQWQAVMGSNPSNFKGVDLPVERVSWDDCQEFVEKVGKSTGQGCRLPSEAEWEYACRAGTTTPFFWGETLSTDQANYDGTSLYDAGREGIYRETTTSVGSFAANAWGLCDMHGNVWEWCADWYGLYEKEDIKDPQFVDDGNARVLRGGSWDSFSRSCRAAFRIRSAPGHRNGHFGCRVVLCLD